MLLQGIIVPMESAAQEPNVSITDRFVESRENVCIVNVVQLSRIHGRRKQIWHSTKRILSMDNTAESKAKRNQDEPSAHHKVRWL